MFGSTQPALGAALKVFKDLNLFEKWHARGNVEMTATELAELVNADAALLCQCPFINLSHCSVCKV